jgi:hypothetical protein
MVVLFPGAPLSVAAMAIFMEATRLITAGWLASWWRVTAWVWRLALVAFIVGLAAINATGVYAQLVAAHVGERGVLHVEDVDAMHAELSNRGAIIRMPPRDQPYGQREMVVATPDGHRMVIGQPLPAPAPT